MTTIRVGVTGAGDVIAIDGAMSNRHGLITGATGTGKTVTLQTLATGFSRAGVPVFAADVKGDLSGIAAAAALTPRINERLQKLKIADFQPAACPTVFWDVFAERGLAVRTTVSEMGPLLLGRILTLNDTQSEVLHVAFKFADDEGLLLLDLKDLQALLAWMAENAQELKASYGNIASSTIAAIQRAVLQLVTLGGEGFFGEPALRLEHLRQRDYGGQGVVSILDATKLLQEPLLYSTFLLWLLSELFEELPEIGDLEKPKLVFFFDEAHLLFRDAPRPLLERIEQVVRLVRSKGVGVFFVTQSPADVPEIVLAQLGNRVQHALRAYTPKEQRALRAAAESFRPNPKFDTATTIAELEVGEALVSFLDAQGKPSMVERVAIVPPQSQIGPLAEEARKDIIRNSPLAGVYERAVDRESAFEVLRARHADREREKSSQRSERPAPASRRQSIPEAAIKSIVRSIGSTLGRAIARGVLGTMSRR